MPEPCDLKRNIGKISCEHSCNDSVIDQENFHIQKLVSAENGIGVNKFWKTYTIKDSICKVADTWEDLPTEATKRGCNKLKLKLNMNLKILFKMILKLYNFAMMFRI